MQLVGSLFYIAFSIGRLWVYSRGGLNAAHTSLVRLAQDTFHNVWVLRTNYFILFLLILDKRPAS
jgi:hypothetical protein